MSFFVWKVLYVICFRDIADWLMEKHPECMKVKDNVSSFMIINMMAWELKCNTVIDIALCHFTEFFCGTMSHGKRPNCLEVFNYLEGVFMEVVLLY